MSSMPDIPWSHVGPFGEPSSIGALSAHPWLWGPREYIPPTCDPVQALGRKTTPPAARVGSDEHSYPGCHGAWDTLDQLSSLKKMRLFIQLPPP